MNDFFSRFIEFAEYYGVNKASEFSKKTGLQHQTVSNYLKGRKPDADSLAIIQQSFEDLDMCWLLTGNGQMLKQREFEDVGVKETNQLNLNTREMDSMKREIKLLRKMLEKEEKYSAMLEEQLKTMKGGIEAKKA